MLVHINIKSEAYSEISPEVAFFSSKGAQGPKISPTLTERYKIQNFKFCNLALKNFIRKKSKCLLRENDALVLFVLL